MSLQFQARIADRHFDLGFNVEDSQSVALLGPNGAGKSTTLSVIAGLLRPDSGRVVLGGKVLADIGQRSAKWSPPHARKVVLMAQDALLFPHLSVIDNVAFAPQSSGKTRTEARITAGHWLEQVDAAELARRMPAELSGGQAQRIAVARALAADPALLLLDEPLSAVDVGLAPVLRQMLRRVLHDRMVIIVTHDPLDALLLAERVVVMDHGRVVEEGETQQVLNRPRSAFGASLAGRNLLFGTVEGNHVRTQTGEAIEGRYEVPVNAGDQVVAGFSPGAVAVHRQPPGGSPRNALPVVIAAIEPHGELVRIRGSQLIADITLQSAADLDLVPGAAVYFVVKATEVMVYPA